MVLSRFFTTDFWYDRLLSQEISTQSYNKNITNTNTGTGSNSVDIDDTALADEIPPPPNPQLCARIDSTICSSPVDSYGLLKATCDTLDKLDYSTHHERQKVA